MGFFLFVTLVLVLWLHHRHSRRIRSLESKDADPISRLRELEYRVARLEKASRAAAGLAEGVEPEAAPPVASPEPLRPTGARPRPGLPQARRPPLREAVPATEASEPTRSSEPRPWTEALPGASAMSTPDRPSEFGARWSRLERQLIENWTGILGSAVLVAGITFIGGYTGLLLSPFYRCLLIVGAAVALGAGGVVLGRGNNWKLLAQWLKSSAAAVFLFACFASSAVPGLAWLSDLPSALGLLLVGVAVNLLLAFAAESQPFASLHVVLSLLPLGLIPQSPLTLVIATLVSAAGIGLAFRARWEIHTLVVLAAFIAFQAAWYTRVFAPAPTVDGRLLGIVTTVLVGGLAALTHYRRAYAGEGLKALSWITHLASWSLLGAGLALYHVGNTPLRGAMLCSAGVAVFLLARYGRKLGIRWLYLTDTLVGQALVTIGLISFYPFVTHWLIIPALVLLQTGLYLRIVLDENEDFLVRIGVNLVHLSALALAVSGLVAWDSEPGLRSQSAAILLGGALLAALIHLYLAQRRGESFDAVSLYGGDAGADPASILGVLAGMVATAGVINLDGDRLMIVVGFGAVSLLAILARQGPSAGLALGSWMLLLTSHLWSWVTLLDQHPMAPSIQLTWHLGPLLLTDAVVLGLAAGSSTGRLLSRTATYLAGLTVALACYTLLQPVSSLAPGVAWLTLSLLALELANRARPGYARALLHLGYVDLVLFGGAYTLVVLQAESYLGQVPVRLVIELFALGVAAYWWRYRPSEPLAGERSWRALHPLFLELALAFLVVVVTVEVNAEWRPLAWAALALVAVSNPVGVGLDARFRGYSLFLFWVSIGDLVAVTATLATPSATWYLRPGFAGALTIALQAAYLALGSPLLALADIEFPTGMGGFESLCRRVAGHQARWLYYPFFIGVALFLYWRFEAGLLTLLWVAEAFVVFALSLVLRESHFRYMALAGLACCVVRLLVFDMAQANLGLRGIIFVGVGALMLGMHSLYNKYRGRFV